jgi:hypothetical protein
MDELIGALRGLLKNWTERNPDTAAGQYYHDLKKVVKEHNDDKHGGRKMSSYGYKSLTAVVESARTRKDF